MRLTPELFEKITGCKESALEQVGPRRADDPRGASRLPLAFRTIACRLKDGAYDRPIPVQVCDISVLGIGLTHAADVLLGKKFAICLKARTEDGGVIPLQCETVTARPVGKALVRVGATFTAVENVHSLLRALPPRPAPSVPPASPASPAQSAAVVSDAAAANGTVVVGPAHPGEASPELQPASSEADEIKRIRDAMLS